ncbi:glutathione-dependent disulfide-bond oxidoreductase [Terasakiella sp. A23]|uniref:glutathione-dependent disulfide-bond oxidoreductase n=1 Tax=Terasakiella sp. FCG-A23 TaxID=3080561 RepID=UPI0029546D2D|nr:glutathione-dependent disulfide-bond oxidoreductase [Terasakiella sp. A23]MDV7338041.1 glutathione-dependent disulfide-bond oxidoreductase [Terasakiella sp. A23]
MTQQDTYIPPKVWHWDSENGGAWAKVNRPISGATYEADLPKGKHPLQLYSYGTPNGQKVAIMLEELLEAGVTEADYDAFFIDITEGEQFSSGFVDLNPNSKIPALFDAEKNIRVFETSSILLYLAEKYDQFLPHDLSERTEVLNWLFWSHGTAPFLGGGFGHFYHYAPAKYEYAINRYAMEAKRQLHVLDKQLADKEFITGDSYTIADIAIWAWYGNLVRGALYNAAEFLQVQDYQHVVRWAEQVWQRPAVQRGRRVNRVWGDPAEQLRERHDASDFTPNS